MRSLACQWSRQCERYLEAAYPRPITPSDSTALARLLAEERFPFAQRFKSIANLAHKDWTDKENIRWLFEKIEQIAIEGEFQAARVAELKGEQP